MIEIAPETYWKKLNFEDAKLYCFSLTVDGTTGWRLPEFLELDSMEGVDIWDCWYTDWLYTSDIEVIFHVPFLTIPVRDLPDD